MTDRPPQAAHRGPGEMLRKLRALVPADRRLLAAAAALLVMSALGLWLLPVQRLRLLLRLAAARLPVARRRADAPERVRWAVAAVRRVLPGAPLAGDRGIVHLDGGRTSTWIFLRPSGETASPGFAVSWSS